MYKHVRMLDLYNNGVGYEVVVVKEDKNNGDVYFISTDQLDEIDYMRMAGILRKRDSQNYEMWDLLSNVTLKNGMNALEYFHQLVRVKTRSGEIMRPNPRRAGMVSYQTLDPRNASKVGRQTTEQSLDSEAQQSAPKRSPGRPKKSS